MINLPGARKVYQRKNYTIYAAKVGYIVHNINKEFESGHTHVRSFIKAKSLIDLCVRGKLPNRPVEWEIECLIRISDDINYTKELSEIVGGDVV